MAGAPVSALLRHIHRLADPPAEQTDGQLLLRFVGRRDEAAFAALLRRHSRMVWSVCRHRLHHEQDAEDAFQAVFLILARRAAAIRKTESVACWLHGVAYRIARKAVAMTANRRRRELQSAVVEEQLPSAHLAARELQALLDEELECLPAKCRAAFILCCLEGRSRKEAAAELGWKEGTLSCRIAQARQLLQERLVRRGITLSAALTAGMLWGRPASAALIQAVRKAAAHVSTGQTVSAAASPSVAALVDSVAGMAGVKAKIALVVVLAGIIGGTLGLAAAERPPAAEQQGKDETKSVAALPKSEERKAGTDAHGDPLPPGAIARLGSVRFNHGDGLNALYFLPDGKTILSEGGGTICLWDVVTGKEIDRSTTAKPSFDDQTILSPDGKTLTRLNQEWDDDIRVWDVGQRKETRAVTVPQRRSMKSVYVRNAISPDGKLCALNMEKEIRVLDVGSAEELWKQPLERGDEGRPVTFAGPDLLVTADKDQFIRIYQSRSGNLVRQFKHGAPVQVLTASPDGKWVASLEHHTNAVDKLLDKDTIRIWDPATGTEKHRLVAPPKCWTLNLRFAPDGKQLLSWATGSRSKGIADVLTVWEVETGKRLREMPNVAAQVMTVSPDGKRLACGLGYGKFELYDLTTGKPISSRNVRDTVTLSVVLSSDGTRATTVTSGSVSTWDASTGRSVRTFELPNFGYEGPYLSPDGQYVVTNKVNEFEISEIQVWDTAAGKQLQVLWHAPKETYHYTCAFDTRSTILACAFAGKVHLADLRAGKEIGSFLETRAGWPWELFLSSDRKTLFIAGLSKVAGYEVPSGKELFTWQMEPRPGAGEGRVGVPGEQIRVWRKFIVSTSGPLAAGFHYGGDSRNPVNDRIFLCNMLTGRIIRRWSDSGIETNGYEELAFSADGRLLATSDFGGVIHVWEVVTGQELFTFKGHRGEVRSLAFSANGRRLASTSTDSTVLIWNLLPTLPQQKIDDEALATLWADLRSEESPRAYAAVWQLVAARDAAVRFIQPHIQVVPEPDKEQLRQLIDNLDSETFAVREKANKELQRLGAGAWPALREALKNEPSTEFRRRAEKLLDPAIEFSSSPDELRRTHALHVLEQIGTPEARGLLKKLAEGAREARLTRDAKAALGRLDQR